MATLTSPRHVQAREELFNKFHEVALLNEPMEASRLTELGIIASPLDLNDEEHFPRYFLPMSAEKLAELASLRPELNRRLTTGEYWEDCPKIDKGAIIFGEIASQTQKTNNYRGGEPCVLNSTPWIRDTCYSTMAHFHEALDDGEPGGPYKKWRLHARYDTHDDGYPHLMGVVHNDTLVGEPLVRSDLLCAMGLIIDRMEKEWTESQLIFPIMLLSFSGTRGRIIHAHFDGSMFHFRYSPYYDLMDMEKETVDLFVRWLCNEPIGDTAIVAPMDETLGIIPTSPSKSDLCNQKMGLSVEA